MTKNRSGRARPPAATGGATDERSHTGESFPIVGVGASAGGLEAFSALLKHLPLDTGMGFVLVQHLDPEHDSALTQLLGRATALPVHEVTNQLRVEPNHVYVIPPNTNLSITSGVLTLGPRPRTRTPHRSIDFFLEALAEDRHERAIGVILSGTATDGTLGLEAIKAEGGITFAQDESARYDSMPRSAVAAGCVDFVLSPEDIAHEIARIAKHPAVAGAESEPLTPADDTPLPSGGRGTPHTTGVQVRAEAGRLPMPPLDARTEEGFQKILLLLRNQSGVDFSLYKSSTIQRRIMRRLVLSKQNTLDAYGRFLRGNTKELDALYSDVLISVTSFFRTPETFDVLQRTVFPALLQQSGDDPIRVWVLGCSTGQEAYSIGMAFVEAADKAARTRTLQIFATDLNDALLEKARHGLYAKSLAQDLSPERLRRFFVEEEGGYRVNKSLREMVVFARQNVISDPPFSRMDLISCRNLLIYLEPDLQKKVFPVFHYALKSGGFLCLGASESIGGFTELFEPVDKKQKIYAKKAARTPAFQLPARTARGQRPAAAVGQADSSLRIPADHGGAAEGVRTELSAQREADRIAVNRFAPPGVLINADLQILQFRGSTSAYLEPPSGKASFDVLKMARNGLMLPLRAAITKAKKDNTAARKDHVKIEQDGAVRIVNVEVIPLKNLRDRSFLVVFEDAEPAATRSLDPPEDRAGRVPRGAERRRIAELEADLAETRDYLQSVQEQHEAANEELQASNEEVQSANEELQSINEELETSKEELESSNEELTTVNEEMANRNADLRRSEQIIAAARDYAESVVDTVRESLLVLHQDLRVESANRAFYDTFHVTPGETEGRFLSELGNRQWDVPDLRRLLETILPDSHTIEGYAVEYDFDKLGRRTMLVNARRMRNAEGNAARILLAIEDITERRLAEDARRRLAAIIESSDDAIISKDLDGCITTWNRGAERLFGYSAREAVGQPASMLIPPERSDEEPFLLERIRRDESTNHYETVRRRKDGTLVDISLIVSPVKDGQGRIVGASKIARDITERKRSEETLRQAHDALQSHADELARFNRVAVGRELRMIALKKEINELRQRLGELPPYPLAFEQEGEDTDG